MAEPIWGYAEPLTLPVLFEASGARTTLPPEHARANLAEAAAACLDAIAAREPPECMHGRRGEIVFLIPWSADDVRPERPSAQEIPIGVTVFVLEDLEVTGIEDLPPGGGQPVPEDGADER